MTAATRERRAPARQKKREAVASPGNAEPQLGHPGEDAEPVLGAPRQNPAIPPGYKQTEVGVIPEDWEVKRLGEVFTFSGGVSASREQLSEAGHCYLHYGDIHTRSTTNINVCSEISDIPKLNVPLSKVPPSALLLDGDVVFVDASEDEEGTSKHVVVVNPCGTPFISGLHTIVAKPRTSALVYSYRRYCFQMKAVRTQFRFFAVGTKVSGVSKGNIGKINICIPPTRAEQEAIAGALSDADAWIESLEKLIEKKRAIKQGAMQAILAPPGQPGHQRLPGFKGEWEVKRLGEIADIRSGGTPATGNLRYWGGGIPWCTPTDITALNGAKYLDRTERTISQLGLESSSAEVVPANSIVMTSRATIGECAINRGTMTTNQGFKNLIPFEDTHVEFLFYLMLTQKQGLIRLCGGSTFLEIGKTQVQGYAVSVPPSLPEQSAIAAVLSDMDAEIEAVEAKLAKARQIKQGMMQELLTGRVRLV